MLVSPVVDDSQGVADCEFFHSPDGCFLVGYARDEAVHNHLLPYAVYHDAAVVPVCHELIEIRNLVRDYKS
jgi:hypothetical protein